MTDTTARVGADDLRRQIFVTIAALAVFQLASMIPMPAINTAKMFQSGVDVSGGWERVSILALGIIPWFSALTLAEFAVLTLPMSVTRRVQDFSHASPFAWPVMALALAFAAIQGYGVSVAMQQVPDMVVPFGIPFALVGTATLMGGTALTIALARIIQTLGVGFGFWILLAATGVSDVVPNFLRLLAAVQIGATTPQAAIGLVAGTIAAVAALVTLAMTRHRLGFKQMEPLMWPIQLAGLIVPWIAVAASVAMGAVADVEADHAQAILVLHQPVGLAMLAAAITGISYLYARREDSVALWLPTTGLLLVLSIGAVVVQPFLPPLLLTAGHLIITTCVAYVILTRLQQARIIDR